MMLADAVDSGRLVATFLELVAIDSPLAMEKVGREVSARFSELGCQLSQDEVDNLIAVCRAPWPMRCSCRLTWTRSSRHRYSAHHRHGVIRTDGSTILGADDKSGIAGCLELLRRVRAATTSPTQPHARAFAFSWSNSAWVIVPESRSCLADAI